MPQNYVEQNSGKYSRFRKVNGKYSLGPGSLEKKQWCGVYIPSNDLFWYKLLCGFG